MRAQRRRLSVSISAAVAAILACHAPAALAQQALQRDLPAQPLAEALRAVGQQLNLNIVFDSSLVKGRSAPPLDARLSADQALDRLLQGTDIGHRYVDENTIVLTIGSNARQGAERVSESATGVDHRTTDSDAVAAGSMIRVAQAQNAPASAEPQAPSAAVALEEVVVTGLVFKYDVAESVNKMGISVKDTPQSVRIVTQDMLKFSHVTKFEDSYKLDAGAHTSHSQDQFVRTYLRGFQLDAPKIDGFRTSNYPTLDLAPFERFEIIKGATSTIYGQSPIGGTINAVSKKPLREHGAEFSLEGGNWGHYRGEADLHGALGDKLSYRLVGAYLDEDSFLDYGFNKRKVLAPSLKYDFTEQTSLTLIVQYQNADFLSSYGFGPQFIGDGSDASYADPRNYVIPDMRRSLNPVKPDGEAEREFLLTRAYLEHHFENEWMLRANFQTTNVDVRNEGSYAFSSDADGNAIIYMYLREGEEEGYSGEVNLFGDVEAFGRNQTLFLGLDYLRRSGQDLSGFGNAVDPAYPGFNVFQPDYGVFLPFPDTVGDYPGVFNGRDLTKEYGMTAQTILRPTDHLSFMLGTRYSRVEIGHIDSGTADPLPHTIGAADTYTNSAWTFQGGITYSATKRLNLYGSYGETFRPRNEQLAGGGRVGPEEGVAYEVGAKGELLEGNRISWSVALFDIARTNISQPVSPSSDLVVLLGEQRSRGFEIDVQGEIVPGWDVYASAASLKNEFEDGQFDGFASYLAPKLGLSLFTNYEFQKGGLRGFGIGGGVVYKKRGHFPSFDTDFPGPNPRPDGSQYLFDHLFDDPLEVDLRVFYRYGRWNFEISGTNVFGDKYYSPVENTLYYGLGVNPGPQALGKVTYKF